MTFSVTSDVLWQADVGERNREATPSVSSSAISYLMILVDRPRGALHRDHSTGQFERDPMPFSVFSGIFDAISTYGCVGIRPACQMPNIASAAAGRF